ncbi:MAG: PIN domain-containing protein [Armatimonadota bacterium]|nr:PIN domain-containing protein [Armatimonadota bacterium]
MLNVAYVARKSFDVARMRAALTGLMALLEIITVDEAALRGALTSPITGYEDAVQHECALVAGAEAIITRDAGDFQNATLPIYAPDDFIAQFLANTETNEE